MSDDSEKDAAFSLHAYIKSEFKRDGLDLPDTFIKAVVVQLENAKQKEIRRTLKKIVKGKLKAPAP